MGSFAIAIGATEFCEAPPVAADVTDMFNCSCIAACGVPCPMTTSEVLGKTMLGETPGIDAQKPSTPDCPPAPPKLSCTIVAVEAACDGVRN